MPAKKVACGTLKQYEMGIYPLAGDKMRSEHYEFLPDLFLRAPFYSFEKYSLGALPRVLKEQYFQNAVWLASPVFNRS
jgi:hypothetical protein